MPRTPSEVTEAELSVLQLLWEKGDLTIRQLTDVLYPQGGSAHYATVQKLLERLETKGFVNRDRGQSVHVFFAAVARDVLVDRRLQNLAEQLCNGSLASLVTHLVRSERLSPEERQSLRALIDQLDTQRQNEANS